MPLDSRIPLSVQGPEPFNGLAQLGQIRAQQQQEQVRDQQIRSNQALEEERRQRTAKEAAAAQQEAELREEFASAAERGEMPKPSVIISKVGPERGIKIVDGFAALRKSAQGEYADTQKLVRSVLQGMNALPEGIRAESYPSVRNSLVQQGVIREQDAPPEYSPEWFAQTMAFGQEPKEPKLEPVTITNPDGTKTTTFVEPKAGQEFTSAAPPVAEPKAGTLEDYIASVAKARGKTAAQLSPLDKKNAKAEWEAAGRAPTAEKARFWVIRDGKQIRISEDEYRPGDLNASGREQGRPVTSGDASDLADFGTSLDELSAVRAAISPQDSTGIVARVGATLPYVTQLTGWGTDAKKRQAVIDRVKQVIGKTLEGGVLRKEDEAKYEKILPNIGDAPDVATSKLDGLDAAIQKRQQRRLDALADAGYDTSKYAARGGGGGKVTVTDPNGTKHDFASQAEADAFKKLAGIP